MPVRAMAVRNSRQINASRPERIPSARQLLSVPQHSYSFKTQRVFRILAQLITGTPTFTVTTASLILAIREELGIALNATAGETVAAHEVRVYAAVANSAASNDSASISVSVFDIEETNTTGSNLIDRYLDSSSVSGIAHIGFRFPVNNRPTFNRSTAAANIFSVSSTNTLAVGGSIRLTIDIRADYTRISGDPITFGLADELAELSV